MEEFLSLMNFLFEIFDFKLNINLLIFHSFTKASLSEVGRSQDLTPISIN